MMGVCDDVESGRERKREKHPFYPLQTNVAITQGLVMLPYLGVRYFVDGGSVTDDAGKAATTVIKKLPGLDK
jgi:hypothetical protein